MSRRIHRERKPYPGEVEAYFMKSAERDSQRMYEVLVKAVQVPREAPTYDERTLGCALERQEHLVQQLRAERVESEALSLFTEAIKRYRR